MNNQHSRFIKVKCNKCKNEQDIFGKSSTEVKCLICNEVLASPAGGKAVILGKIIEVLD
ncbi:MAG: 30S ribosomal protein S27e [archaeon]